MVAFLKFAAVAAVVVASPVLAVTQVHIQSAGIYAPGAVQLTASQPNAVTPGSGTDYSAPVRFTANYGTVATNATFDFIGFCVDLFHPITVAIDSQTPLSLNYHTAALTTDSNGHLLSASQIQRIGGLATLGFQVAAGNASDRNVRLAAIQQAIWTIEYPTLNFAATGPYANQQSFADAYVAQSPTLTGTATAIYADDGATQGFLVPGVPEPATWALLVTGFGFVGVSARRRRTLARVTA